MGGLALLVLGGVFGIGYLALRGGSPETSWSDYKEYMTSTLAEFTETVSGMTQDLAGIIVIGDFAAQQIDWMDTHQPAECYRSLWSQQRSALMLMKSAGALARAGVFTAFDLLQSGGAEFVATNDLADAADAACE